MQKTMKKVLSLVLSLMIIMPCVGIIPVNAAGLDRTELDAVIEQANAINADDYVDVSAVNAAVEVASSNVLNTQTKIDDMTAKIQLEMTRLEKVLTRETKTITEHVTFDNMVSLKYEHYVTVAGVHGGEDFDAGWKAVYQGKTTTVEYAKAYVYVDKYNASSLKDLNLVGSARSYGSVGKWEDAKFLFNNVQLSGINNSTIGSWQSFKNNTLDAELPGAGEETVYQLVLKAGMWDKNNNKRHDGVLGIDLSVDSYDTTALREAIDLTTKQRSMYTAESYEKYIEALKAAMEIINTPVTTVTLDGDSAVYEDITAAQTAIDNAAEALNSAYNNLELTVQLDMTAFDAAVDEANAKISESDKYVSVEALQSVLDVAVTMPFETQDELDDMTAKLQLEITRLEKVSTRETKTITEHVTFDNMVSLKYEFYATLTGVHGGEDFDAGWNAVFQGKTTTVQYAKAFVYADKYYASSLKDLNLVGSARAYGHVGKWELSQLYFNDGYLYGINNATKNTWQNFKNHTLDAELPIAGEETVYKLVLKSTMWDEKNNKEHYGVMGIDLNIDSYDTTALREAIAKPVDKKSDYSIPTYAAYVEALENATNVLNTPVTTVELDGEGANYADIAAAQIAIDNAAKKLDDAYNALKKGFDIEYYSDGVLFKTQTVFYTDLESTLISDIPTKPGHIFNGTWKAEDGTDYTVDKIAHDFVTYDGSVVRLDANFDEVIYTIKFVDGDGNVLQTSSAKYHETVSYNGATPTKTTDDEFEYTFNGNWSPEVGLIEDDTTYVAQFDGTAHNYNYTSSDKNGHSGECTVCGHKIENAHHHFESTEVTVNGQKMLKSICTDCNYSVTVKDYNVSVPAGCTVTKTMRTDISEDYVLVTIQAPLKDGWKYFVNWVDSEGKNVGTYRTYSFFLTGDCSYSPKYYLIEDYVNARKDAEIASRVTGINSNDDGTYSIYTEHSVSTSVGSIVGHGVLYTTDAAFGNKDSLVYDNDNIKKKAAKSSASTLTGLLEVRDEFTLGETVYARSYIITAEGEVIYSEIKSFTVSAIETSSTVGTLSTELFDLTEINAGGDETIDPTPGNPTPDEPTNPAPQNPLDKVTSIFNKIVEFITMIIKFFKSWEVVK